MDKHIIEGIRRAYDAFSRGDVQGAVDAVDLDPDILWREPEDFHAGGTYRGRQGVAEYLTLSREPFEKAQSLPEEILEVGDKIVVFVHFHAWPKEGGQPLEGRIADVYTIQMGRLCRCKPIATPKRRAKPLGFCPTTERLLRIIVPQSRYILNNELRLSTIWIIVGKYRASGRVRG